MTYDELHKLGQKLFSAAIRHAKECSETVMEDGRDEHFWQTASATQLLEAATEYFHNAT